MPDATKYDVTDLQFKMFQKIVDKKRKLTIRDIYDYQDRLREIKFSRKYVNNKLKAPDFDGNYHNLLKI